MGTAALAPLWADPGVAGDEFREAIFYAQAHANRHICSELGVQFSANLKTLCTPRRPQAPKGPPRDPQGTPKGPPRDPRGTPEGPKGNPKGAKGPKIRAHQSHSKGNQNKPKRQTIYQRTPDQPPALYISAQFTANELNSVGFTVASLLRASFSKQELQDSGTIAIKPAELKVQGLDARLL